MNQDNDFSSVGLSEVNQRHIAIEPSVAGGVIQEAHVHVLLVLVVPVEQVVEPCFCLHTGTEGLVAVAHVHYTEVGGDDLVWPQSS